MKIILIYCQSHNTKLLNDLKTIINIIIMIRYNIDKFLEIEKLPTNKINIYGSNLKQNSLKKLLNQTKNKVEKPTVKNDNVWVVPSLNHNVANDNDKTKLHLSLTQLTEKNKDDIFDIVLNIIKKNNQLISLIYDFAIQQDYYSNIYSKLCVYLRDNIVDKSILEKKIIDSLETFFYSRLENESKYQSYIKFISYLGLNKFISSKIIEICIDSIILNLKNESINCSQEILSLYNIFSITKFKLNDEYRLLMNELSTNKQKIKLSKDRFKIKDIIELQLELN
jgi:hypothetical protein